MSDESLLIVRELKVQVHQLFGEFERIEKSNEALKGEIVQLQQTIGLLEKEKGLLNDRFENLRMARSIESGCDDSRIARNKINKILREIDKCVALLSE